MTWSYCVTCCDPRQALLGVATTRYMLLLFTVRCHTLHVKLQCMLQPFTVKHEGRTCTVCLHVVGFGQSCHVLTLGLQLFDLSPEEAR